MRRTAGFFIRNSFFFVFVYIGSDKPHWRTANEEIETEVLDGYVQLQNKIKTSLSRESVLITTHCRFFVSWFKKAICRIKRFAFLIIILPEKGTFCKPARFGFQSLPTQ